MTFIAEKGKQIISINAGRQLITVLPNSVKSPGLTGLFEQLLDGIADGRFTMEQFLKKQSKRVASWFCVRSQDGCSALFQDKNGTPKVTTA